MTIPAGTDTSWGCLICAASRFDRMPDGRQKWNLDVVCAHGDAAWRMHNAFVDVREAVCAAFASAWTSGLAGDNPDYEHVAVIAKLLGRYADAVRDAHAERLIRLSVGDTETGNDDA